jgi:hypothetical protein
MIPGIPGFLTSKYLAKDNCAKAFKGRWLDCRKVSHLALIVIARTRPWYQVELANYCFEVVRDTILFFVAKPRRLAPPQSELYHRSDFVDVRKTQLAGEHLCALCRIVERRDLLMQFIIDATQAGELCSM